MELTDTDVFELGQRAAVGLFLENYGDPTIALANLWNRVLHARLKALRINRMWAGEENGVKFGGPYTADNDANPDTKRVIMAYRRGWL
jgi:hypothetical protein